MKKGKGAAFSEAEIDVLLNFVELYLLFGAEQWEKVGEGFRQQMTHSSIIRDTESLRGKCKALRNHKKPTGEFIILIPLL